MGRGPHTVPLRALLRHAGVGSPRGRDPRGSRSSRISPPPPRRGPFWGGGGHPLGGAEGRSCGSLAGGGAGGGVGGPPPPPPRPVGRRPAFCCPRRAPPGVYSCRGGCRAAAGVGRGPVGRRRVSAAGGGNPPALVRVPVFPGPASDKAAPFAQSWASPVRCRPAAGRACGRLPRPWCPRTPGAAASSGGVWGRRFFGLPPSALGPEWEGGGGVGGALWSPGDASRQPGGGAAWRSRPRGPAIGWGVQPFPRPALARAGPSCRPSLGPFIPPAVVARRWPAGGGCEG